MNSYSNKQNNDFQHTFNMSNIPGEKQHKKPVKQMKQINVDCLRATERSRQRKKYCTAARRRICCGHMGHGQQAASSRGEDESRIYVRVLVGVACLVRCQEGQPYAYVRQLLLVSKDWAVGSGPQYVLICPVASTAVRILFNMIRPHGESKKLCHAFFCWFS